VNNAIRNINSTKATPVAGISMVSFHAIISTGTITL